VIICDIGPLVGAAVSSEVVPAAAGTSVTGGSGTGRSSREASLLRALKGWTISPSSTSSELPFNRAAYAWLAEKGEPRAE
jgi:hypothetical protein